MHSTHFVSTFAESPARACHDRAGAVAQGPTGVVSRGWSEERSREYEQRGYVLLDRWFADYEVRAIRAEVERLQQTDLPGRVLEKDGRTVRALHGPHLCSDLFARIVRLPRLVTIARTLLDGDVYVYQLKINLKARFTGDVWQWHQDYIYWRREDRMPEPRVLNVTLFLDDVTEFNGPMMLIPGSQRHGLIDVQDGAPMPDGWSNTVSADLKYQLPPSAVERLVVEGGLVAPKGAAGTVLVFHPNVAHASPPNLSPFDRQLVIITYNSTTNAPARCDLHRPEWLVTRNAHPLDTLADDTL